MLFTIFKRITYKFSYPNIRITQKLIHREKIHLFLLVLNFLANPKIITFGIISVCKFVFKQFSWRMLFEINLQYVETYIILMIKIFINFWGLPHTGSDNKWQGMVRNGTAFGSGTTTVSNSEPTPAISYLYRRYEYTKSEILMVLCWSSNQLYWKNLSKYSFILFSSPNSYRLVHLYYK